MYLHVFKVPAPDTYTLSQTFMPLVSRSIDNKVMPILHKCFCRSSIFALYTICCKFYNLLGGSPGCSMASDMER